LNVKLSVGAASVHLLSLFLFSIFWIKAITQNKWAAIVAILLVMLITSLAIAWYWIACLSKFEVSVFDSPRAMRIGIERAYEALYRNLPYLIRLRPSASYLDSILATREFSPELSRDSTGLGILQIVLLDRRLTWAFVLIGFGGLLAQLIPGPPSFAAALASVPPLLAIVESAIAFFASSALAFLILRSRKTKLEK
jgi:hypothetical protein